MISTKTIENSAKTGTKNQNGNTGVIKTNTSTAQANPIGINAVRVIDKRYAWKDETDKPTENWGMIVERVVSHVAKAETLEEKRIEFMAQMSEIMNAREFVPNTPCLVNAGKPGGQLAACFVLPVEDSIEGIMAHAKNVAIIHQTGGGCISGDARVWTSFCGLEPIEVLFNRATADGRAGQKVGNGISYDVSDLNIRTVSMDPRSGETNLKQVSRVWKFDVGQDHQLVVRTRQGSEIQTSSWHPFMVVRGTDLVEVRADALQPGDVILRPESADKYLPENPSQAINGFTVDTEIGWLIGFILGDGSFDYVLNQRLHRLRLYSGTKDVLEKAQKVLSKMGGYERTHRDKHGLYSLCSRKQSIVHSLFEMCGLIDWGAKFDRIRIPEVIAKSSIEVIYAFVAGLLDSDGYVDKDGSPSYTTASCEMAQDLTALVSFLGFQPGLQTKQPQGKGKSVTFSVQLCVLPEVNRLANRINVYLANELRKNRLFSNSRKQDRLKLAIEPWRKLLRENGLAGKRGTRPKSIVYRELNYWSCDATGRVNRADLERIGSELEKADARSGSLLRRIASFGSEVKSIETQVAAKPFYDLTVEEWNTYAAGTNGLVMIHNTGQSYEFLRPAGAAVNSTKGVASGPVSFMNIVNTSTDVVKQGGVRRGANMGILRVTHPDILRFIHAKNDQTTLTNFNISVTVTDKFMEAVENGEWFQLEFDGKTWDKPIYDPVTGKDYALFYTKEQVDRCQESGLQVWEFLGEDPVTFSDKAAFEAYFNSENREFHLLNRQDPPAPGMVYAPDIWNRIIASAHKYAEPGVIFIDEVNRHNLLKNSMGEIYSCNPCVTADTLVYTEQGLKTVRDLYESRKELEVTVDGRFGYKPACAPASKVFRTGTKPVYRLQTKEGYFVRATENHEIMTSRGWRALKDLNPGEHIHILNRKGGFGITGSLAEGRVWGWLVGDGHFNRSQKQAVLSFYQDEQELASGFAGYVNQLVAGIGRQASNYQVTAVVSNENLSRVHSVRLMRLAENIGLTENKLQVPDKVFEGSENMQRGFLQGIFSADGTVADQRLKGRSVRLTSISLELLEGVQQVLLNFGIVSRIYKNRRGTESESFLPDGRGGSRLYKRQPIHELVISKSNIFTFADEIGFLQTAKRNKLKQLVEGYRRKVSQETFVARVESMLLDGEEDVFDLTQPETSSFIANGIVVHNCAEEMLHANNACNLGSIDVSKFFKAGSGKHYSIDWDKLQEVVGWSIRFLDNVIDVCSWTLPEMEEVVKRTRPIGLGIMGFADLCLKLKIRYGSEDSLKLMDVLMRYVRRTAWNASLVLGIEKGAFPEFKANHALYKEFFDGDQMKPFRTPFPLLPRNYEVTTIAPTGTISLVAETSSGIEPNFSWAYHRRDTVGERSYVHPLAAEALGIEVDYSDDDSIKRAAEHVVENQHLLPDYFVTAMDLTGEKHVRILAAAQRHVDNSISKTCNGKADDTVESVDKLYRLARELGCKAVSYYRDGSREGQVLTAMTKTTAPAKADTDATSETAIAATAAPAETKKHVKTERPRELQGSTWVIDFDGHKLYVTVNHDGVKVLEVFASGFISNGVGILASTMLQSDCFSTEEVARKLDKITSTNSVWFNERLLTSPEQAVAECLRIVDRRLKNLPEGSRSSLKAVISAAAISQPADTSSKGFDFKECPKCREIALVTVANCPTCQSCGFSKCS